MNQREVSILSAIGQLIEEGKSPPYTLSDIGKAAESQGLSLDPDFESSGQVTHRANVRETPWAIEYSSQTYTKEGLNILRYLESEGYVRLSKSGKSILVYPTSLLKSTDLDSIKPFSLSERPSYQHEVVHKKILIDLSPKSKEAKIMSSLANSGPMSRLELRQSSGIKLEDPETSMSLKKLIAGGLVYIDPETKELSLTNSGATHFYDYEGGQFLTDPKKSRSGNIESKFWLLGGGKYNELNRPRYIHRERSGHKVLKGLESGKRLSKWELGEVTGVKPKSISDALHKLLVQGLVEEKAVQEGRHNIEGYRITDRGRKHLSTLESGSKIAIIGKEKIVEKYIDKFPVMLSGGG